MPPMPEARLDATEREVLARFVESVPAKDVRAVWLYGSRARGESTGEASDGPAVSSA